MSPATDESLGHPEWLRQFAERLRDYTPVFGGVLDEALFEQLDLDALAFRTLLTSGERQWVLSRVRYGVELLSTQPASDSRAHAHALQVLELLPRLHNGGITLAGYDICNRLLSLVTRLLRHPGYIARIGADLTLLHPPA